MSDPYDLVAFFLSQETFTTTFSTIGIPSGESPTQIYTTTYTHSSSGSLGPKNFSGSQRQRPHLTSNHPILQWTWRGYNSKASARLLCKQTIKKYILSIYFNSFPLFFIHKSRQFLLHDPLINFLLIKNIAASGVLKLLISDNLLLELIFRKNLMLNNCVKGRSRCVKA